MQRVKTFNATGIAPAGRLYAGDLNAIQDAAAALTDLTQNVSVGSLAVGESGLVISRYGAGEFRMVGAVRTDGVMRGLGGLFAGTFTTTTRDSIPAGATPQQKPYGLVILNTTTNRLEWNSGTDAAPTWRSVAADGAGSLSVATRWYVDSSGAQFLGPGGTTANDVSWQRVSAGAMYVAQNGAVSNGSQIGFGEQFVFVGEMNRTAFIGANISRLANNTGWVMNSPSSGLPGWLIQMGGTGNDNFFVYRAPNTAGTPVFTNLMALSSSGTLSVGNALIATGNIRAGGHLETTVFSGWPGGAITDYFQIYDNSGTYRGKVPLYN